MTGARPATGPDKFANEAVPLHLGQRQELAGGAADHQRTRALSKQEIGVVGDPVEVDFEVWRHRRGGRGDHTGERRGPGRAFVVSGGAHFHP